MAMESNNNVTEDEAVESADVDAPEAKAEGAAPKLPEERIARLEAELAEARDQLLRAKAECVNVTRRLSQERQNAVRLAGMDFARSVLHAVDSIELTRRNIADRPKDDPVVEGVRLIAEQLDKALRDHGVVPVESVGGPFDPTMHEALMQDTSSDQPPGTVTEEFQRGYRMHDRVLRHARVKVAGAPEAKGATEPTESAGGDESSGA
jgi:molecular chaperone GrpE